MAFHWQSKTNVQNVGVEDMVLLQKLNEHSIVDNLKKRLHANSIYTYIGPVLVAVNPFKDIPQPPIEQYQAAAQYENPPHVYALADNMYRNVVIDNESQCVIISGESGAGKTVTAKIIMNYLAKISGGGQSVQHVKNVILYSNPLLEAFGNSATSRNSNSSRFGKYVEIYFSRGGEPIGGKLSNFLLEKSRVVQQLSADRNFHIFYQLCNADRALKSNLSVGDLNSYKYLRGGERHSGHEDAKEFENTLNAMRVIGMSEALQHDVLRIVSAVLQIGNISFDSNDSGYAAVSHASSKAVQTAASLLGLTPNAICEKLTCRSMEGRWGNKKEEINVTLNVEQATYTRDALAKALYSRLFDLLVSQVNKELHCSAAGSVNVGILDIYGFELFDKNGFNQFCINYVNEKLQQIFIELTLKAEQEIYVSEGIHWTPIEYFNNKIVCDLIEAKNPPGIMSLCDDTCQQIHAQSEGVDKKMLVALNKHFLQHPHYQSGAECFIVKHYAGDVVYDIDGFCDSNRDVLYNDLIYLMQDSSSDFVRSLFPDTVQNGAKRPTTASMKMRTQANALVTSLMQCNPHYVRCVKPNDNQRSGDWNDERVLHQVQYLGLKENIRVRRAGFAYRREFAKFVHRYAIVASRPLPSHNVQESCRIICQVVNIDSDQYQMGKTKIFIKNPESLFLLEETRERKFDGFARKIQQAWRKHHGRKQCSKQKQEASDLLFGKKERRRFSLNRNFVGDYIGLQHHPALQSLVGKRERVHFACTLNKYDRRFKTSKLDVLITDKHITLIGRMKETKGPNKGRLVEVIKRQIDVMKILSIGLSPHQDDFVVLNVRDDYTSLLETPLKTEMITALSKRYKERANGAVLPLHIALQHTITLKKARFGGGTRTVAFALLPGDSSKAVLTTKGNTLTVSVGHGLPNSTRPSTTRPKEGYQRRVDQMRASTRKSRASTDRQHALSGAIATPFAEQQPQQQPVRPAPRPKPAPKPVMHPQVEAMYDYEAQDTDELSFNAGDLIELVQKHESGWWQGKLRSKVGLMPANYVREL